jgi:hypothetical protein
MLASSRLKPVPLKSTASPEGLAGRDISYPGVLAERDIAYPGGLAGRGICGTGFSRESVGVTLQD